MIKIRDLEYLQAVDEFKHFGRAAEACNVSQPTLSGQIMKFEEQLGLQLIERHRGNVMLTPAGERLVFEAKNILRATKSFSEVAKTLLDPLAGNLHIGLIPTIAPYLLPHIMEDLHSNLPKINFFLYENKTHVLLGELNQGKIDIGILSWLSDANKFDRYDLFEEPLILATHASHPLAQKESIELNDLNGQAVLTLEDGNCLRNDAMGYCFSANAFEDDRFRATSLETLRFMVAGNLGITLLPQLSTTQAFSNPLLRYVPFQDPQPTRQISLIIRPNYARMECVRAVVASIRQSLKKLP